MANDTINVARDFSRYPAGRFKSDGPHCGEALGDMIVAALNEHPRLRIDFRGSGVGGASFLEECFGGLVRRGIPAEDLQARLDFEMDTNVANIEQEIRGYISDAGARE